MKDGHEARRIAARPASAPEVETRESGGAGRTGGGREAVVRELLERAEALPARVEMEPETVERDLARIVLTLVEFLRRVVEHQAVLRMDDADLTEAQVERMGVALLRLEEKMKELQTVLGVAEEELNVDLGPLGTLL